MKEQSITNHAIMQELGRLGGKLDSAITHIAGVNQNVNDVQKVVYELKESNSVAHRRIEKLEIRVAALDSLKNKAIGMGAVIGGGVGFLLTYGAKILGFISHG